MTREEAVLAMKDGKKVTHNYFSSSEYLRMINGSIHTEDGYYFTDMFYEREWFATGWRVFHG